jgi:hypothetical protein
MHKEAKTHVRHLQNKEIATEKWLVVQHDETYLVTIIQPPYPTDAPQTVEIHQQRGDDVDSTQMTRETKQSQRERDESMKK